MSHIESPWISPKVQLPKPLEIVLIKIDCEMKVSRYYPGLPLAFEDVNGGVNSVDEVYCWMPIPKPFGVSEYED